VSEKRATLPIRVSDNINLSPSVILVVEGNLKKCIVTLMVEHILPVPASLAFTFYFNLLE